MADHIEKDDRFKHISKDPRFRRMRKNDHKVKIDKRFKGMFDNKKFSDEVEIDKRGRTLQQSKKSELKRYYHMSEESDSEDEEVPSTEDAKFDVEAPDYARGEGLESSSEESDEETNEAPEEIDLSQAWGQIDANAETGEDSFKRFAVCNMDWDRIRAVDILVLCSSFVPKGGSIESVTIYPSEYGKERMKKEDFSGPIELKKNTVENEDESDEDGETHMQKLRQYQLNRLKYFYAVVDCDSVETADRIYKDLDGSDYESSGTKIDLRFIPDDMTFEDDPREVCDALPSADSSYEPESFVTKALHQSKVECTWDETDRERTKVTRRKFGKDDLESLDLKDYLASSSSEDEAPYCDVKNASSVEIGTSKESRIDIYRKLIASIDDKVDESKKKKLKAGEIEVTFEPGLKEKTEKLVKGKLMELTPSTALTPFENLMNKKKNKGKKKGESKEEEDKDEIPEGIDMSDPYFAEELKNVNGVEKKKKKKVVESVLEQDHGKEAEALQLLVSDEEDLNRKHFDMKKIQKEEEKRGKKKKKQNVDDDDDGFEINTDDTRFAAINTDPKFNIDQSNPNYKKTKSSLVLLNTKLKKRTFDQGESDTQKKKKKESAGSPAGM